MASHPNLVFGQHLPLPPNAMPFGMVFGDVAAAGKLVAANDVVTIAQNPPGPMAITRITGFSDQAAGFAAQIYVTRDGQQRRLASLSFHAGNMVGTAKRPFDLAAPEVLDPNDMVTVEVSNYANAGADIQVVLWGAVVQEGA